MVKRSRVEDVIQMSNPFINAKKRKKTGDAEGRVQHTIKYYVWELLRDKPTGLTVDELVHEMESREMRSFANCSKPASQVQIWRAFVRGLSVNLNSHFKSRTVHFLQTRYIACACAAER